MREGNPGDDGGSIASIDTSRTILLIPFPYSPLLGGRVSIVSFSITIGSSPLSITPFSSPPTCARDAPRR